MAVDGELTYHVLDGYDPRWQALIRQGIDEAGIASKDVCTFDSGTWR